MARTWEHMDESIFGEAWSWGIILWHIMSFRGTEEYAAARCELSGLRGLCGCSIEQAAAAVAVCN
jgi:hypothetical protein